MSRGNRRTKCLLWSGVVAGLACLPPRLAHAAEPCDAPKLRVEADRAWAWRRNWTLINAGVMAGSFAVVPLVEREDRPDWIVSGIGSGITALTTFVWPLRVESAADELEALPTVERARQLRRLWRESAEDEHDRVTWPWHLANFGVSAAAGAIIAFGYHHYVSGAITTLAGTALGEVQIFTQPTRLDADCQLALRLVPSIGYVPRTAAAPERFFLSLHGSL
jgi:hypothetical protein